jgi:hypothetical protein
MIFRAIDYRNERKKSATAELESCQVSNLPPNGKTGKDVIS